MSSKRKRNSTDPRKHPGADELDVLYPGEGTVPPEGVELVEWLESNPPEIKTDRVTRDEFLRRMAGNPVLDTLYAAGRDVRVITLMEPSAIMQWWDTGAKPG